MLAIETARRLACDASLVGLLEDEDGEPLNVGRKTRAISPALNRALRSRDGGCRFVGCGRTLFTEGHHIKHWADGGETKLSNLITLCGFHHGLLHEGGFGLHATGDGNFVFTRPDGSRIERNGRERAMLLKAARMHDFSWSRGTSTFTETQAPTEQRRLDSEVEDPDAADSEGVDSEASDLEAEPPLELFRSNRDRGLDIDATTAQCGCTGERMDYDLTIDYMAACRDEARARTEPHDSVEPSSTGAPA